MKSIFSTAIIAIALSGCATYTIEGEKYSSKDSFFAAAHQKTNEALGEIQPLPQTLTKKNLIFARSSLEMTTNNFKQIYRDQQHKEIDDGQMSTIDALLRAGIIQTNGYKDAIKRRNIYKSVNYVEISSAKILPEATSDTDVLYFLSANGDAAQWYYVSKKSGQQVFPFDQSKLTAKGRTKNFVEAVEAAALRD